jgi:predicted lipoprotein with Yx(FWY)xxD motif
MKNIWVWAVLILIILVVGFMFKHQIKTMLMGTPTPPPMQTTTASPSESTNSATAPSDNIYKTSTDPKKGAYLTDFAGKTLYIFDKDTTGVSNCYNVCAALWPPYTSGATAEGSMPANITVIKRTDGSMQFAYKGMPLYYYAKDTKAGDTTGDGVGGTWHLVKP